MTRRDPLARKLLTVCRRMNAEWYRPDRLAERAENAALIRERSMDGQVRIVTTGTDCDGYRYRHGATIPASVMAFEHARQRAFDWADGPCGTFIDHWPEAA